jgi:hypothetical protein
VVPLGELRTAEVAGLRLESVDVGVLDMAAMAGLEGIGGFLSLDFFREQPVTVDYPAGFVVIEDAGSLAARAGRGCSVPVEFERQGPSLCAFMGLDLPGGEPIKVEIDMGSDCLILDSSLAERVEIDLGDPGVRRVDGEDETGHEFSRYFTQIKGLINPTGAEQVSQTDPDVMFQKIIHDGLLGSAFLRTHAVTFDAPNERVIFS